MKVLILTVLLYMVGCCDIKDKLFFVKADLLDIQRDDDGQFHILIKYETGEVIAIEDISNYKILQGDYKPSVEMPYVKWDNCTKSGILRAWGANSTDFSGESIRIFIPEGYTIELFDD